MSPAWDGPAGVRVNPEVGGTGIWDHLEFLWWSTDGGLNEINDPETKEEIEKEIADIFNYLVKLVDLLDMDLEKVALNKIKENAQKYPIEKSKGKAVKYKDINNDKS